MDLLLLAIQVSLADLDADLKGRFETATEVLNLGCACLMTNMIPCDISELFD
jgi:hypothetical protein